MVESITERGESAGCGARGGRLQELLIRRWGEGWKLQKIGKNEKNEGLYPHVIGLNP